MRRRLALVLLWLALGAGGWVIVATAAPDRQPPDAATANDLAQTTAERWPHPVRGDYPAGSPAFTVLGGDGRVVLDAGAGIRSDSQAYAAGALGLDVARDGSAVARVYVLDPYPLVLARQARHARDAALGTLAVIGLAATGWVLWLDARILRPFRELQGFAGQVARGDLDAPLAVHRGAAFGAFSESFDILRTELARSRAREAAAQDSRKALVSQLSHDIRTPLATIQATGEVMQLTTEDPRLRVIVDKARQIDSLTRDLLAANATDAEDLGLTLTALGTPEVAGLIAAADDAGWVRGARLPDALIVADRARLMQVLDNILGNARKYAAPPVIVTASLADDLLTVSLTDAGPGVPEAELPLVTQRHYRAANAAGVPGQGLGLHTAYVLMEAMGGALTLDNDPDGGFTVALTFACAEREHDPRRHAFRMS